MKYVRIFILLLLIPLSLFAWDWSDYFGAIFEVADFFVDPNAGQYAFPILLIPLGGVYEGMGTAYTAVALDNSFIEANPAGGARQDFTELSLTHNNWIADVNFEGFIYSLRFKDLGIAAAGKMIYTPFTGWTTWNERSARTYYTEAVGMLNVSYNFFNDYYFNGVSLGATLKGAYRFVDQDIYPDQSIVALMADVGFLTRFNLLKLYNSRDKNFSVGLSAKNIGPPVAGDPLPSQIVAGIAYSPLRPIIISTDFTYPMLFNKPIDQWERPSLAIGTRIQMTSFYSLQAGFRYQGGNPRISFGSQVNLDKISIIVNYTFDLATQLSTALDRFSIEAKFNLGDGGRAEIARKVDAYYIQGWRARSEGQLEEAIAFWQAALELDPTFTPAKKNILTTQLELSLADELNRKLTNREEENTKEETTEDENSTGGEE